LASLNAKELYNIIIKQSLSNKINYVFLDEVQEVKEFEKCVIGLFENKKIKFDIFITGSNSHMFSKELATLMTGRTSEIQVFPLTYKELKENKNNLDLTKYLKYGGLGIVYGVYDKEEEIKK
jgi:predicted AAA+ superfamily ATPase